MSVLQRCANPNRRVIPKPSVTVNPQVRESLSQWLKQNGDPDVAQIVLGMQERFPIR